MAAESDRERGRDKQVIGDETVYLKTARHGSISVFHTNRFCSHLLMAYSVVEKDRGLVEDFLRECKRCSGDWEPYSGGSESYVGQCRHCDGPLDASGDCPFCAKYEQVIEA